MADLSSPARDYLLALADDEHIIGARHTAWIGAAPFLEEDLAFCSIAQDELGHAIALYEMILDDPRGVDEFALRRDPGEYRSCELVELPCDDWADALVRHWMYDHAEILRWQALAESSVPAIAALAARAIREEAFHVAHADALIARLLDVVGDSRERLVDAAERLRSVAGSLWSPIAGEDEVLAAGIATVPLAEMRRRWWDHLAVIGPAGGDPPEAPAAGRLERSAHFASLQAEIRRVIDLDPTATW